MNCAWQNCKSLGKANGKGRNRAKYCRLHLRTQRESIRKCGYCCDPMEKNRTKWCSKCANWFQKQLNKSPQARKRKLAWYHWNKLKESLPIILWITYQLSITNIKSLEYAQANLEPLVLPLSLS